MKQQKSTSLRFRIAPYHFIWLIILLGLTPKSRATITAPSPVSFADGEQYDPDLGLYHLRARYYNPATGRFWTMDSWEGGKDCSLSLNKYLYTEANPLNLTDPTGHFGISGSLSGISIGSYVAGVGVSYGAGKVIEAGVSLALSGDLSQFSWLSGWDLLNVVPGGAMAKLWSLRPMMAAGKMLQKTSSGKWVGRFHKAVQGGAEKPGLILKKAFESAYPGGITVRGLSLKGGNPDKGMRHILERHVLQFWNGHVGADTAGNAAQHFWPLDTTVEKLAHYYRTAAAQLPASAINNVGLQAHPVTLANGISAQLVTKGGEVITFFPVSGPGVVDWNTLKSTVLK